VPLRSGGEVGAVIELFSPSPDPRNDTLESALRNIALQVGHLLTRLDAERQLQTIVRTVPSAVFRARLGERRTIALSFMSAQIETLWGVPAHTVVEHSRRVLWKIPRAHRRQLLAGLSEAVLEGSGWDVTVPVQTPHGMRWLRIHAALSEGEGAARAWDGIVSDVTEQKLAERQVVLLNLDLERRVVERTQELAELNIELEAFTDSVSHDLRAPLRGMRGYAALLKSSELPDEAAALVERIIAQGEHMDELIDALLELSQISRSDLRRTGTDMSEIAMATLQELQGRDAARRVHWQVEPGMRAHADARLMRVLFENLLGNAWKFTRERAEGRIEVGRSTDARGAFFVRDNGAGFDPAYAERLFQPFQRLHAASRFEGTGIGLATVQRIVRRHGGRIWAESKPDRGATFHFELPPGSGDDFAKSQ
jgi:signal transduction histidine kinase